MNFTSELPTTPGWYVWRFDEPYGVRVLFVEEKKGRLFVGLRQVSSLGGQWCKILLEEDASKIRSDAFDVAIQVVKDYASVMRGTHANTNDSCGAIQRLIDAARNK